MPWKLNILKENVSYFTQAISENIEFGIEEAKAAGASALAKANEAISKASEAIGKAEGFKKEIEEAKKEAKEAKEAAGGVPLPASVMRQTSKADPSGKADSTKAFEEAAAGNAAIYMPAGSYLLSTLPAGGLIVTGKAVFGDGPEVVNLLIPKNTKNATVFQILGEKYGGHATLSGFKVAYNNGASTVAEKEAGLPTEGATVLIKNSIRSTIHNIEIEETWIGFEYLGKLEGGVPNVTETFLRDIRIHGFVKAGIALADLETFNMTGAWVQHVGAGGSGTAEKIKTAKKSIANSYALWMRGNVKSSIFHGCEFQGSQNNLKMESSTFSLQNQFVECSFETSDKGVELEGCQEFSFEGCWFSNGHSYPGTGIGVNKEGNGCQVGKKCKHIEFVSCTYVNCGNNGCQYLGDASTKFVVWNGCRFIANNLGQNVSGFGLWIAEKATDFVIVGCTATNINQAALAPTEHHQTAGIQIEQKCKRFICTNNLTADEAETGRPATQTSGIFVNNYSLATAEEKAEMTILSNQPKAVNEKGEPIG